MLLLVLLVIPVLGLLAIFVHLHLEVLRTRRAKQVALRQRDEAWLQTWKEGGHPSQRDEN